MREPQGDQLCKLTPPPRTVPVGLTAYLLLLASQLGWLFLSIGMLAFWFNCAFGADVKTLLFLRAPLTTTGTVTSFEVTPLVESTGSTPSVGGLHRDYGTQAIFAVHYTYAPPGSGVKQGTSYEGASVEGGPMVETPQVVAPIEVGLQVPVQYVHAFPSVSRVEGMRSNVYPVYVLGVLVFACIGVVLLRPALKNYRRIQFLLKSGVEDTKRRSLEDPDGHLLSLPLEDPALRWFGIREGHLHPPGLFSWMKVLIIPLGGVITNSFYLWHHWKSIAYTWHTLIAGG